MFYFSNKENQSLTDGIFGLIRNATKYIKTGNFFFRDPKIHSELIKAADRGVAIFVLSNLTGNENRGYRETKAKAESDPHIVHLHEMEQMGIHVHLCRDLHAKFLIADGQQGLIMSANYTPDSLYGNPENGVDVLGIELSHLEDVFDELYLHPDTVLQGDGQRYRYAEKNEPIPFGSFDNIGSGSKLLITISSKASSNLRECNYRTIYDKILNVVNESKAYLHVISWSFSGIEKLPEFIETIEAACNRGVKIYLYYGTKGENWQITRTQKQIGILTNNLKNSIEVIPLKDNHAKCVLSEKDGMMFTSNIDGENGLLTGFELGCVLSEAERTSALVQLKNIVKNEK